MSDLPYGDRTDFENAERGRIDALDPCVVRAADGRVVWDLTPYAYLDGERPDTVHPSLWRQAQDKARAYADAGDLRFAAELLKHAVFADPDDRAARSALADVYERLGYGAENATWRSFYLSGTQELRRGVLPPAVGDLSAGMAGALTIGQWFDSVAIRVNGPRAAAAGSLVIDCQFTDAKTTVRLALSNGALIPTENPRSQASADLTLTLTKAQLPGVLAGHGLDGIEHTGDPAVLGRLTALLDTADPAFPIVTP